MAAADQVMGDVVNSIIHHAEYHLKRWIVQWVKACIIRLPCFAASGFVSGIATCLRTLRL